MTVTLTLPPETEDKLRARAAETGQTVEGFLRQLVEREVHGGQGRPAPEAVPGQAARPFDEIFAPLRDEVERSGVSDEELDRLLGQAREEVWHERQAKRDKGE